MMPAAKPLSMSVDVIVESGLWAAEPRAEATVRRAIAAAAETVRALLDAAGEVSVVLTDDAAIRALNRQWRHLDQPTNVLSFPAPRSANGRASLLGDIAVAYETTAREATKEHKPLADHLAHLAVHGFLHLVGYDHGSNDAADEMERLEAKILARIGVPDPYAAHAAGPDAA